MTSVKIPTSKPYHEFIMEKLKNPEHAAGFLTAILEEEKPEPDLLKNALNKVLEAQHQNQALSDEVKSCYEKLAQLLEKSSCTEIYTFIELLNGLGFQILIQVKEDIAEVQNEESAIA